MGGFTGKYSRSPFSTFNEEKNYAFALMQEGVPVTDDDENSSRLQLLHHFRRGTQLFGNYGTPNNGFRVQQASSIINNFSVTGGGPLNTDIEGAGRFFMRGLPCVLMHDVDYLNTISDIAEQSIHPRITRVYYDGTDTVVEDSAANWATNEIQGRSVRINTTDRTILSNGQDSFKISGDHTVGSLDPDPIADLDYYILLLSTPGGARTDGVYLNVYIDEYDDADDPEIAKKIGGVSVVAQLRAKIIQTLFVREDVTTYGELVDYVDSDGNQHYVFKIASLARLMGDQTIISSMITDLTPDVGYTNIDQSQIGLLKVIENPAGANDQVYVQAGVFRDPSGAQAWRSYVGGLSPAFSSVITPGNGRYDVLYVRSGATPVLRILEGTESGSPSIPDFPISTGMAIAVIYVDETATPVVISSDITDVRPLMSETAVPFHIVTPGFTWTDATVNKGVHVPVWLRYGSYDVTSSVMILTAIIGENCDGCELHLSDTGKLILGSGARLENLTIVADDAVGSLTEFIEINGSNVQIRNCIFTGASGTLGRTNGINITSLGSENIHIEGCQFVGGSTFRFVAANLIVDGGNQDSTTFIKNNHFEIPTGCTTVISNTNGPTGKKTLVIADNTFSTTAAPSTVIDNSGAASLVVTGNTVTGASLGSSNAYAVFISMSNTTGCRLVLTGNHLGAPTSACVKVTNAQTLSQSVMSNNTVYRTAVSGGPTAFVLIDTSCQMTDCTIEGNVVTILNGASNSALIYAGTSAILDSTIIANNIVETSGDVVRVIGNISDITISGNRGITANSFITIIGTTAGLSVLDNTCETDTVVAIISLGASTNTEVKITGNTLTGLCSYGIYAGAKITGSTITDNIIEGDDIDGSYGIYVPIGDTGEHVISRNRVTEFEYGIYIVGVSSEQTSKLAVDQNYVAASLLGFYIEIPADTSISGNTIKVLVTRSYLTNTYGYGIRINAPLSGSPTMLLLMLTGNNVEIDGSGGGTNYDGTYGIDQSTTSGYVNGAIISSNYFYAKSIGTATGGILRLHGSSDTDPGFAVANNKFTGHSTGGANDTFGLCLYSTSVQRVAFSGNTCMGKIEGDAGNVYGLSVHTTAPSLVMTCTFSACQFMAIRTLTTTPTGAILAAHLRNTEYMLFNGCYFDVAVSTSGLIGIDVDGATKLVFSGCNFRDLGTAPFTYTATRAVGCVISASIFATGTTIPDVTRFDGTSRWNGDNVA